MQHFQENWRAMLDGEGYEKTHLERVLIDPKRARMLACFTMDELPPAGLEQGLQRMLIRRFAQCAVQISVSCPALREDFFKHPSNYAEYLTGLLLERAPGAASFLRTAEWDIEGGALMLRTQGNAGASYLVERGCLKILELILHERFKADLPVQAKALDLPEYDDIEMRQEELRLLRQLAAERDITVKSVKTQMLKCERTIYGNKVLGTPLPIGGLTEESGVAIIEGKALSFDIRALKDDSRMLVSFGVTDYTGSILVKVFIKITDEPQMRQIEPGLGLRIRGECRYDKFAKELSMIARDIILVPWPERKDDEPLKRIELHLHTQMSVLDGVASVTSLMNRAAKWGQDAIAVTDHGVLQAFPDAFDRAAVLKEAGTPVKLIPGMEGYLVADEASIVINPDNAPLARTYVVLDVRTTGPDLRNDHLIEIAAVRICEGQIIDEFSTFVDPGMPIPDKIVLKTQITDEMVHDAPASGTAIRSFVDYLKSDVMVAHNAASAMGFLASVAQREGLILPHCVVDTLPLSRALLPELRQHSKLTAVCKTLGIALKSHHRAVQDARATARMLERLLDKAAERGITTLTELNVKLGCLVAAGSDSHHIVLLATTEKGKENLYRLTSISHMQHFYRKPRIPRSVLAAHREGLLVGSACESGELFQAILESRPRGEIEYIAKFYDYLEIQPTSNNAFLIREGRVIDDEGLRNLNRAIVQLGDNLGIPVCATCDVHFLEPEDAVFREILMQNKHFSDAAFQAPLYMRTTREMLEEFAYLGKEKAFEVVVTNTRAIAESVEDMRMFPEHPKKKVTFQPILPGAERLLEEETWKSAHVMYGDILPDIVNARILKELNAIVGNGFATLYLSARLLVQRSIADGYLVGSRGSVGSSLVATLMGITEVNPLQPHYLCPDCKYSDFNIDAIAYPCGEDLPSMNCPHCGSELRREGYDIPFEVFLGFDGDKVPDIDLNFSGVYQSRAQAYVKSIFGEENVFKAGTIGTLAEKKAYGEVLGYLEKTGRAATSVERERLVKGITGVKVTTGQHPGGMVVVPKEYDIHAFSPIQHPADKKDTGIITTHFDFGSLHDILVKLDILGHDDPTMIHMLEKLTGVDVRKLTLTDPKVMSLFTSTDALRVTPEQIGSQTGTLGIPEFGTVFVRGMLAETRPTTMEELLRISGLSHGTNVWLNNAQDMIRNGVATLKSCFCTRDDVMNTLITKGVPAKTAFTIMEIVRKGQSKIKLTDEMVTAMRKAGVGKDYIDSCFKIEYLFPRAHAVAYVMMALRIAYFKVYYPLAYYTAYFTVRADEFDASLMLAEPDALRATMKEISEREGDSGKNERLIGLLELVLEMRERGFSFAPVDLYESSASEFSIQKDTIRPPLNSLPGIGLSAAEAIVSARSDEPFLSIEHLQSRSKVSRAVIEVLRQQGCLKGLPQSSQVAFF